MLDKFAGDVDHECIDLLACFLWCGFILHQMEFASQALRSQVGEELFQFGVEYFDIALAWSPITVTAPSSSYSPSARNAFCLSWNNRVRARSDRSRDLARRPSLTRGTINC